MGFLDWIWKRKKSEPPPEKTVARMRRQIDRDVATGVVPVDQIIHTAVDVLSGDYRRSTIEPIVERLAHEAMASHIQAQAEWPTTTDCDRLDNAFNELEQAGVVSRQHFSCCGTCRIWDRLATTMEVSERVYHCLARHVQPMTLMAQNRRITTNRTRQGSADGNENPSDGRYGQD